MNEMFKAEINSKDKQMYEEILSDGRILIYREYINKDKYHYIIPVGFKITSSEYKVFKCSKCNQAIPWIEFLNENKTKFLNQCRTCRLMAKNYIKTHRDKKKCEALDVTKS